MPAEAFVADGWRLRLVGPLAVASPLVAAGYAVMCVRAEPPLSLLALGAALCFVATSFLMIRGLVHRQRPVVVIDAERVEFGSIFDDGRRDGVALRDVASVRLSGGRLLVSTRVGGTLRFGVGLLSRASRLRVADAVARRARLASGPR